MAYEVNEDIELPKESKIWNIRDDAEQQAVDFGDNKIPTAVVEDRGAHIDSVMIKLMKVKKVMLQKVLVDEVMAMLKFPQTREQVEARVKDLMRKGYL